MKSGIGIVRDSQQLEQRAGYDIWLLFATTAIAMYGALFVLTSSAIHSRQIHVGDFGAIFWNHSARVMLGACLMMVTALTDYHLLQRLARAAVVVSLALLVTVLFVKQPGGATAHRWITLLGFSVQPAEIAKFSLIAYLAARLSEHEHRPESQLKNVYKGCLIVVGLAVLLIILEPNLSMAILVLGTTTVVLYLSGIRIKPMLLPGAISLVAISIVAWFTPYMHSRLVSYISGIIDPMSASYQVKQALVGIGQGGIFGVGLGESTQKHFFLPEPYKDFIFSVVGEEWGLWGAMLLLALYLFLLSRGWKIALGSPDRFGYYLGVGICASLTISILINVGVTLGLIPATGQPLPLFSYGGSSLLMTMSSIGILLNISKLSRIGQATSSPMSDLTFKRV